MFKDLPFSFWQVHPGGAEGRGSARHGASPAGAERGALSSSKTSSTRTALSQSWPLSVTYRLASTFTV